jgi:DNA-binding MarR family transcriptional regulator
MKSQPVAATDGTRTVDLESFLPYVMDRVIAHWHVRFSELLAKEGLTFEQWRILLITSQLGPMNIKQLSEHTVLPYSTLGRWLARMEKSGLVRRCSHPDDRRAVTINITSQGRRKFETVLPIALAEYRYATSDLSPLEESAILYIFRRIENNIRAAPET